MGLSLLALVACKNTALENQSFKVSHMGALKTLMTGDLHATVDLDSLSRSINLYALGALENLKGEIQIYNGQPFISQVDDEKVTIQNNFNFKASLLVYSIVDAWLEIEIPKHIQTLNDFEEFLLKSADSLNIDILDPFPFLIEGLVASLPWHIIDWPNEDKVHTHEKHQEAGLNGVLTNEKIDLLGFYSLNHKGVFTHHSTNLHMHFKNKEESLAGHVDALVLGTNMILKLPKP